MQITTPAAPKLTVCARIYSENETAHPLLNRVVVVELQVKVPMDPGMSAQQLMGISLSGVAFSQSSKLSTPQHSN